MTTQALTIKNLRKTYADGVEALKGIDLSVTEGDFFALLGPNGAGKTTIIGIISSLVTKGSGDVCIFENNIDKDPIKYKQTLGIVPQEFNFNQFDKVEDILITQAGYYGISAHKARPRVSHYLKKLDLWDKRHEISRVLSGGMKRRLMIARALVHEPKILILDEPSAGVDIELRRSLWDFLKDINGSGTTIILTTHYLEEAEQLCRNIAIINKGEIIQNCSTKSLLEKSQKESFILDIREPITQLPYFSDYVVSKIDAKSLEAEISKSSGVNSLFKQLSAHNIEVVSMRNKTNRLEELFVNLTNGHNDKDEIKNEAS
ncbi:MAG: ABC transporter ATP-binding protein [Candidatus Endonucleobacter sp. (ex Gigantidas childressi)]|nr:ABC transporter ATP-binding protein [Candidatus Endonucleobacter sp. (ex Gigantidas childressi)]